MNEEDLKRLWAKLDKIERKANQGADNSGCAGLFMIVALWILLLRGC